MNRALRTAALGMTAQSLRVDNIANNLSNVNTTAFKKSTIEFQDLFYQSFRPAGVADQVNTELPTELQVGHGNRAVATIKNFSQGDVVQSGNSLDIALEGEGFFQIQQPDGMIVYTRDGNFNLNSSGQIVNSSGLLLDPSISVPEDAVGIHVGVSGTISVVLPGETEPEEVGRIELAKFINPAGLRSIGGNLYEATAASGEPTLGSPGSNGFSKLLQGFLEKSNVEVVQEMVNLIVAHRAYEINARAIRTAEQMMEIASNIRR
ncbi:MAG: flagellar basal-body rod protein FlgG [bacterium]